MFEGKRLVVGITGGIAAYKAADLVSRLSKEGAQVQVILTEAARHFISPLTLATLSRRPVLWDLFSEGHHGVQHIDVAQEADLVVVAPATANIIAKMAVGLADDLLSTVVLATKAPVLVAPAMNVNMYENPVFQQNLHRLQELGFYVIEPESGMLACGMEGKGRLAPVEQILQAAAGILNPRRDLAGKTVLVTAGGTREAIDPVRYIGNRSSGKMGYAMAAVAQERGARVVLITGPTMLPPPPGIEVIGVETTREMQVEVLRYFPKADIVVKAAAVADYRPVSLSTHKLKKTGEKLTVELEPNPDILAELGRLKDRQVLVGFAAETEELLANASHKMEKKKLDMIVANDVTREGAGFGSDTNIVSLLFADGRVVELPRMSKTEVAHRVFDHLVELPAWRSKNHAYGMEEE
ncbi:phosphopantothenoylcysteine decarboxylase [Clostridiales bacterium PH28_bin88]|nr:phosphopantothenoylcysteine decarboxylase [Clostridiales bacterium PH28_bin88]